MNEPITSIALILEIFKYFAKFPDFNCILPLFANKKATMSGYSDFYTEIENLSVKNVVSEIKNFVFGVNDEIIKEYIKNIQSYYLSVEYGIINTTKNSQTENNDSSINLVIAVAHPFSARNKDVIEESLIMNKALTLLRTILNQMQIDRDAACNTRQVIQFPIDIFPIEFKDDYYQSIGWGAKFMWNEKLLV